MTQKRTIDLNCDMGERPGKDGVAADIRLMEFVTSVNIACGAHAGDKATAKAVMKAAASRNLGIGAHPAYADPANFGRVSVPMSAPDLEVMVGEQLSWLASIAAQVGCRITHVKPHGALYHDAMGNDEVGRAFARAVRATFTPPTPAPMLIALAGSRRLAQWRAEGFAVAAEAFAERRYDADGSLLPRAHPDALITDPEDAAHQAVDIAVHRCASASGTLVTVIADTLCIHSDSPDSEAIAQRVHTALMAEGSTVAPLASRFLG